MSKTLQTNLRTAEMDGRAPVTIVELAGSIDPATLETLEAAMDRCAAEKRSRVIFDMKGLSYINSTGMGMLVQFSDACREEGGALALVRVQPKVLLVIEMLGLQELFHIVADEAAAFAAFAGEAPVGQPSGSAASELGGGVLSISAGASCPACQAALFVAGAAGRYRCPRCLATLEVAAGVVSASPEDADRVMELWLPPRGEFLEPATELVFQAGRRAGLSDEAGREAAAAAAAAWKILAAMLLRHGGKGDRRLRALIRAADGRLTIRTACAGDALETSAFDAIRSSVDRLEYLATAQGNLLTIEKGK